MKRLFLFFLILLLGGCSLMQKEYPSIQDRLMAMTSYSTDCKLTYISNKGETIYETTQIADNNGRYKVETSSPEQYKNNIVLFDGNLVWQLNPNLKENQISINPPDKASRREIILFSFIENYVKSKDTTVQTSSLDESKCTVLEAIIPGDNNMLSKEKLWIDNESKNPIKLIIYDKEGKERIVAEYSKFVYNCKIDDKTFVIEK